MSSLIVVLVARSRIRFFAWGCRKRTRFRRSLKEDDGVEDVAGDEGFFFRCSYFLVSPFSDFFSLVLAGSLP